MLLDTLFLQKNSEGRYSEFVLTLAGNEGRLLWVNSNSGNISAYSSINIQSNHIEIDTHLEILNHRLEIFNGSLSTFRGNGTSQISDNIMANLNNAKSILLINLTVPDVTNYPVIYSPSIILEGSAWVSGTHKYATWEIIGKPQTTSPYAALEFMYYTGAQSVGTNPPYSRTTSLKLLGSDAIVTGTISASNLSGTNTGDQDLSGYVSSNGLADILALYFADYVPYSGATSGLDLGQNNLTVDTNTFFVDVTTHRVGMGTQTPQVSLDVAGYGKFGAQTIAPQRTLTVGGHMEFQTVVPPSTAELAAMVPTNNGAGNIQAGTYYYAVTYYTAEGIARGGYGYTSLPSITSATSFSVVLSNIPISTDPRVIGRKIYRSQVGTSGDYYYCYLIGTIANNTATTYNDNSARATTATDWWYNKVDNSAGKTYKDSVLYSFLSEYVTAIGAGALKSLTRGSTCVAVGSSALQSCTLGSSNVALGHSALPSITTGGDNIGIGYAAMQFQQTGNSNIAIGSSALRSEIAWSGSNNIGIGGGALSQIVSSSGSNIAIGYTAGQYALSGQAASYNIFIGYAAGKKSSGDTTGQGNIILGASSGAASSTGNYNVVIGYNVDLATPNTSSQLNIGNVLFGPGLGTGSVPSSTGRIGIGTTTPSVSLEVVGDIAATGYILGLRVGALLYLSTSGDTTLITQNTYYTLAGSFSNLSLDYFTNPSTSVLRYTGTKALTFKIQWSAVISSNTSDVTVTFGVFNGSTQVNGSSTGLSLKTAGLPYLFTGFSIVTLNTNDEVSLKITSPAAGIVITSYSCNISANPFF